ncbi:TonB-dependent receptor family protein [Photobacterium chitinilyticum]|uniref:TonB-dependent siderophore receptor n=1 Tax=Photobacterium chitinilyticum TaxID=2485123 RepID=A0A444JSW7_9GAMM|nr:TonB-dependent siderophore receptor [Photobacterium chitinilyticum]RWX56201.1 TonB-dependent siderophore receptor [Photobacterium chitinilyticum]
MKSTRKSFQYSVLATAIGASLIANTALAQELQVLEQTTVNSSVIGESHIDEVKSYAGNRTVVTSEQMEKTAVLSIDDALQRVPGVQVQDESGTGVLPNISVRGLKASRSGHAQFLMDGVPMTLAPYGHTGQSIFPATLSMLDRIDIVRGGATVQYGPNNVGGVINLVTKSIPEKWQTSIENKLTVFEGGDKPLNDFYLRTGGRVSDQFAIQLEGNVLQGETFRDNTDTDVTNFQVKTEWLIDDAQMLTAFVQRYDADTDMPGALTPADYDQDRSQSTRPHDHYEGETTRWNLRYNRLFNQFLFADYGEFDALVFGHTAKRNFEWGYNAVKGEHWADPGKPSTHLRTSPREFNVLGVEPRASFYIDGATVNQKLIVGMRFVNEDIDYKLTQTSFTDNTTKVPRDWSLDTKAWAAYISDEIKLANDKLTITPGIRYEHIDMDFVDIGKNTGDQNTVNEWLPGFTASYQLTDTWLAYTNAQRSLRAPQIAYIRGKADEGAEMAWNYELGGRYTQGRNSLNLALYRIDFDDQLQWNKTDQTFDNIGRTVHQGFEVEGFYVPDSLPLLTLHMGYNYLDAEQKEGTNKGNELPYVSKHQLLWDASYDLNGYETTVSGVYFSKSFSDNANTKEEDATGAKGEVPAYMVWNFNISKDLYKKDDSVLRAGFSVNNLFDEDYYFRGIDVSPVGRYPAPGRSFSLDVKYTF